MDSYKYAVFRHLVLVQNEIIKQNVIARVFFVVACGLCGCVWRVYVFVRKRQRFDMVVLKMCVGRMMSIDKRDHDIDLGILYIFFFVNFVAVFGFRFCLFVFFLYRRSHITYVLVCI